MPFDKRGILDLTAEPISSKFHRNIRIEHFTRKNIDIHGSQNIERMDYYRTRQNKADCRGPLCMRGGLLFLWCYSNIVPEIHLCLLH